MFLRHPGHFSDSYRYLPGVRATSANKAQAWMSAFLMPMKAFFA